MLDACVFGRSADAGFLSRMRLATRSCAAWPDINIVIILLGFFSSPSRKQHMLIVKMYVYNDDLYGAARLFRARFGVVAVLVLSHSLVLDT